MPRELVKIVCQAVVAVRSGDRITGELLSESKACYGEGDLVELWKTAEAEVAQMNAAEAELAGENRKQRRAAPKKGA